MRHQYDTYIRLLKKLSLISPLIAILLWLICKSSVAHVSVPVPMEIALDQSIGVDYYQLPLDRHVDWTHLQQTIDINIGIPYATTSKRDAYAKFCSIYSDIVRRCNSVPSIRPFLDEFPLTHRSLNLLVQYGEHGSSQFVPYRYPYISDVHIRQSRQEQARSITMCSYPSLHDRSTIAPSALNCSISNSLEEIACQDVARHYQGPKPILYGMEHLLATMPKPIPQHIASRSVPLH